MTNISKNDGSTLRRNPPLLKRWAVAGGGMLLLVTMTLAIAFSVDLAAFDRSTRRTHDVAPPDVGPSSGVQTLERSQLLTETDAGCTTSSCEGALLSRACIKCHGENLSGGRVPGAPASGPFPSNLTPHPSGLKSWSYADFDRLLTTRVRRNGKALDPAMPTEAFAKLDDRQKRALWSYLQSLPARPAGQR